MRGNRRADAWHFRRAGVQFVRRAVWRAAFYRARLVWLFSKFVQLDSCWHPRRWPDRKRAVALALVAGFCIASLVRMEVSEFYCLADRASVPAAHLFVIPKTDCRTTLFRSHTIAALDDVDLIFRS